MAQILQSDLQGRLALFPCRVGQEQAQRLNARNPGGAISAVTGDEPACPFQDQIEMFQVFQMKPPAAAGGHYLAG
jgi:hypothetical protein